MDRVLVAELLDVLPQDDPLAVASRADLRRLNTWMGHPQILARAVMSAFPEEPPRRVIDLGAGDGALTRRLVEKLSRRWGPVPVMLVDRVAIVSPATRARFDRIGWTCTTVQADVLEWLEEGICGPGDCVVANLFLHHFDAGTLRRLLSGIGLGASALVACEPRRTRGVLWVGGALRFLGCNAVTRHDATASIRAGFRDREISAAWPAGNEWVLQERSAGLFNHLFVARAGPSPSLDP